MNKYKGLRVSFSTVPCLVCGQTPSDKAHIKTKGSSGNNEIWNYMPLCRIHHSLQHQIGIVTFINQFTRVKDYIEKQGWTVETGKLTRKNPK